jgi:hypothetical protein
VLHGKPVEKNVVLGAKENVLHLLAYPDLAAQAI